METLADTLKELPDERDRAVAVALLAYARSDGPQRTRWLADAEALVEEMDPGPPLTPAQACDQLAGYFKQRSIDGCDPCDAGAQYGAERCAEEIRALGKRPFCYERD